MDSLNQGGCDDHHVQELLPEQHLGVVPGMVPRNTELHGALEEEVKSRICSEADLEEGLGGEEVVEDILGVVIPEGVPGHQVVLGELSEHRVQLDLENDQD